MLSKTMSFLVLAIFLCTPVSASYFGELNAPANTGMFGPTAGGNGTATMRAAVPADIPNLNFSKITAGTVPIGQGGTGQTTATTAFDALSPLGAKGDTLVYNSTTGHNVKFTACADGDQIQFDSTVAGIGIKCVVPASGSGTVTSVSVAAANGFTGTVATATTTPAITIIASGCNGVCKSNATTLSTAAASDITGQLLTGFSSGAGVVAATDTILQAINKIVGNAASYLSTTLNSGQIFVGSAGNVATGVAMSGGATISNTGVVSLTNASVTGQALTGFSAGAGTVAATDTILQGFNKLAGNQAGFLPTAGTGLIEAISGDIETVSDKTYVLDQSAAYAYTINTLIIGTSSGTSTVAIKINGTNVTGISAVSVSSTPATGTATAANSVAIGDKVTLVTSATATALDMAFTLKVTR